MYCARMTHRMQERVPEEWPSKSQIAGRTHFRSLHTCTMVIRAEQMRAFEEAANASFEQRMIDGMRTCFPKHGQMLSEQQLSGVGAVAIEKMKPHARRSEGSQSLVGTDLEARG
jgi:hypothetical protein